MASNSPPLSPTSMHVGTQYHWKQEIDRRLDCIQNSSPESREKELPKQVDGLVTFVERITNPVYLEKISRRIEKLLKCSLLPVSVIDNLRKSRDYCASQLSLIGRVAHVAQDVASESLSTVAHYVVQGYEAASAELQAKALEWENELRMRLEMRQQLRERGKKNEAEEDSKALTIDIEEGVLIALASPKPSPQEDEIDQS